jgi:hypothetical protein
MQGLLLARESGPTLFGPHPQSQTSAQASTLGAAWRENRPNGPSKCAQIEKETTGKQRAIAGKHQGTVDHCYDRNKTFSGINDGFDQNTKTNRESVASSERKYQHIVYYVAAGPYNVSLLRFREIDFSRCSALPSIPEERVNLDSTLGNEDTWRYLYLYDRPYSCMGLRIFQNADIWPDRRFQKISV